jgi:tetratricopeptide (TPR) repeat protein
MISRRCSPQIAVGAAVLTLALSAPPATLAAQRPAAEQRGGQPRADTPQLVVGVLASADPTLGIAVADAIRRRIQDEHTATDLYVVPKPKIEQTLRSSGYNPDSVLPPGDLMTLTKQVRGDYALAGTIERTKSGVRTLIRLLTQTDHEIIAEPLAPVIGTDFSDVSKQVDRAVAEALRALAFYHDCTKALFVGDYKQAMAAARQGLKLRPESAALNLCVLSTLRVTHASPDSIIAAASIVVAADSESIIAWANLADAYNNKGDSARALAAAQTLHHLNPGDVKATLQLADWMVRADRAESALALVDTALNEAPANVDLLRERWLLHLRLGQYANALASGAALIAADSSAATSDFYDRQLRVASAAHDSAALHRVATEAVIRFPRNVNSLMVLARDAIDRGNPREALSFAQRMLAVEPGNEVAWQLTITAHIRMNGADSAFGAARRALAAGVATNAVGSSLLAIVAPPLADAQKTPSRANWETVLDVARKVDSIASTQRSAFYLGVSAFQVASDEIQSLAELAKRPSPTRAQRQVACTSATRLDDLVRTVTIAISKGGRENPETAGKVMTALPGYSEFIVSMRQRSCR